MAKRRTKPEPPSRAIKRITACNPSIKNVQTIIDGLTKWVNTEKERAIREIDEQIFQLEEQKHKLIGKELHQIIMEEENNKQNEQN